MSKFRYGVAATALAAAGMCVAGTAAGPAHAADSWTITSFHATLHVQNDGRLQVHEQIVFDFGTSPGHGIVQYVNRQALQPGGPQETVSDVRVTSPDTAPTGMTPTDVALDDTGTSTKITVGRATTTITGKHTYDVDFTVSGAVYADADHPNTAGLLWEAVDDWSVPISDIEVTLTMPGTVTTDRCWAGPIGTAEGCDKDTKNAATVTLKQAHLDADQQLTEQASSALGAATNLPTASAAQYPLPEAATSSTDPAGLYAASTDQYTADPYPSSQSKSHAGVLFFLLAVFMAIVGGIAYGMKRATGGGRGSYSSGRRYESWRETSYYDSGSSWSDNSSSSSFDSGGFSGGDSGGGFSGGDSGQSGGW